MLDILNPDRDCTCRESVGRVITSVGLFAVGLIASRLIVVSLTLASDSSVNLTLVHSTRTARPLQFVQAPP